MSEWSELSIQRGQKSREGLVSDVCKENIEQAGATIDWQMYIDVELQTINNFKLLFLKRLKMFDGLTWF